MAQFTIPARNETRQMRQVLRIAVETPGPFYLRIVHCEVEGGQIGTGPDDFIHTGHVNDLLAHYKMTSDDVIEEALGFWTGTTNENSGSAIGGLQSVPRSHQGTKQ
jgi:transketolase C-terminal domain/subunit